MAADVHQDLRFVFNRECPVGNGQHLKPALALEGSGLQLAQRGLPAVIDTKESSHDPGKGGGLLGRAL